MRSFCLVVLVILPAIALANQYNQKTPVQQQSGLHRPVTLPAQVPARPGQYNQQNQGSYGQRVDPIRPQQTNNNYPGRNTKPGPGYQQPINTGSQQNNGQYNRGQYAKPAPGHGQNNGQYNYGQQQTKPGQNLHGNTQNRPGQYPSQINQNRPGQYPSQINQNRPGQYPSQINQGGYNKAG